MARDLVPEAVDELYGGAPADFLPRRKELAAAARAAKDRAAATAIAALRKPTRSAHLLNQLARREPERVDELLGLADDATAVTGGSRSDAIRAMRELTTRRRRLIDDLTDRAFAGAGDDSPTQGIRDEVVATLNAAVGDPDVATELAEGRLVRSHEWSGFGFSAADLARVPDDEPDAADEADHEQDEDEEPDEDEPDQDDEPADTVEPDDERDDEEAPEDDDEDDDEADHEQDEEPDDDGEEAAGEEVDEEAGDEADDPTADALRAAERDLKAQQRAEQEQQDRITELEDELTEAQIRLDEIRVAVRRAEMAHRKATTAAERLRRARR